MPGMFELKLTPEQCQAEYARLKAQIKHDTEQLEMWKIEMTAQLEQAGKDRLETEYGTFRFQPSTRWKYSKDVEEILSNIQLEAQLSGDAEQIVSKALYFDPIKE